MIKMKLKLTPLHWAARRNYVKLAELLIQFNCNISAKDFMDRTPLDLAIKHKKFLNYTSKGIYIICFRL